LPRAPRLGLRGGSAPARKDDRQTELLLQHVEPQFHILENGFTWRRHNPTRNANSALCGTPLDCPAGGGASSPVVSAACSVVTFFSHFWRYRLIMPWTMAVVIPPCHPRPTPPTRWSEERTPALHRRASPLKGIPKPTKARCYFIGRARLETGLKAERESIAEHYARARRTRFERWRCELKCETFGEGSSE
jgi:hypothetical protein